MHASALATVVTSGKTSTTQVARALDLTPSDSERADALVLAVQHTRLYAFAQIAARVHRGVATAGCVQDAVHHASVTPSHRAYYLTHLDGPDEVCYRERSGTILRLRVTDV
jgi:hypothetical protein